MKKFLNRVSNRIVFRYIVAFFLSSRVPPSFHVPRVYLPMETRALNKKGRREEKRAGERERERDRRREEEREKDRERRKREEEVPIPVSKGRRSRAELRSEGCAGAFHHHPWGRRSRSGATKTEEEGRLVERTHPEMQSRSVGVNRVASQRSSKSTRSRATKRVFPLSSISTFLVAYACRTWPSRPFSSSIAARFALENHLEHQLSRIKSIRGSIDRGAIYEVERVLRVCYEYSACTVRGKCSISLSLIVISIWRHSSPPRVFGNVVSAIRLRPHTGLVIFFKTLFVAVRVMSTIGSNRSDHRWSVA